MMIENAAMFDLWNTAYAGASAAALALTAVIITVATKAIVVVKTKR